MTDLSADFKALADIEASPLAKEIAATLAGGERKGIFLGNLARQHPRAAQLHALAQELRQWVAHEIGGFARRSALGFVAVVLGALLLLGPAELEDMIGWV